MSDTRLAGVRFNAYALCAITRGTYDLIVYMEDIDGVY